MKGFFPWVREVFFGPAIPKRPRCGVTYCNGWRREPCGSGYCAQHCTERCEGNCVSPTSTPFVDAPHREGPHR